MTEQNKPRDNVTQLRGDINRGQTGDKMAGLDPAAAPLGTDDEAAGTPPSPEVIARARRQEHKADADPTPNAANPENTAVGQAGGEHTTRAGAARTRSPMVILLVVVILVALVAWLLA